MTSQREIRADDSSTAREWRAWWYLGGQRAPIILAIIAVVTGTALSWSWLVAVGIAPILLSILPCLVMCGLGLCMNRLIGRSCGTSSSHHATNPGSETTILPVLDQTTADVAQGWLGATFLELQTKERAASPRKSETHERRRKMQSTARTLVVFAVLSVTAVVIASTLHAHDDHLPSSSMTMGRMMNRGNMRGMMERMHMMDHCGAMLRSDATRPNDQWRAPRSPDANGKQ
jgi:hypothetical protein